MIRNCRLKTVAAGLFYLALLGVAEAATVTVHIGNVRSGDGHLMAALCGDRARFVNGCFTFKARPEAREGTVHAMFENVPDGTYAFSTWHDANDNQQVDIPQEGFAYGNNTPYPATFDGASITVAGDTVAEVRLTYLTTGAGGAPTLARNGARSGDGPAVPVREDGLVGAFSAPADAGGLPALLVLGGSEGGMGLARSMGAAFPDEGYAVLTLAYFRAAGLPGALRDIPLEYFKTAIDWLARQPQVDSKRIGVVGISKGAEAALLVASHDPDIRAVVAVSPSFAVWEDLDFNPKVPDSSSWSLNGAPVPYVALDASAPYSPATPFVELFNRSLAAGPVPDDAVIPVERINGPVLLLSGGGDRIWPSGDMAERIMQRLDARHFKYEHRHIDYPDAGHFVFLGRDADPAPFVSYGGGTLDNARRAVAASWGDTLAFLNTALKR